MNKIIAIVLIIIVVVGGFFLFRSKAPVTENDQKTATNTNATEANPKVNGVEVEAGAKMETGIVETAKKVTVNYTDSGFSPKTITVKEGDTVVFVNQSSESLWVASAPHPAHTDYPAFDEKIAISNGGSWSFTFSQIGSWKYHNHKNSSDTGTVVVE